MPTSTPLPDFAQVMRAIEVYLSRAYEGKIPARVSTQVDLLRAGPEHLFKAPTFVANSETPPTKYTVRLGNQFYPHMKLAIERSPDGESFLYKADTHDRHCCPGPDSSEYGAFCGLMEKNQRLAEVIETAWEAEGVPTFKSYLREDLKRRKAAARS